MRNKKELSAQVALDRNNHSNLDHQDRDLQEADITQILNGMDHSSQQKKDKYSKKGLKPKQAHLPSTVNHIQQIETKEDIKKATELFLVFLLMNFLKTLMSWIMTLCKIISRRSLGIGSLIFSLLLLPLLHFAIEQLLEIMWIVSTKFWQVLKYMLRSFLRLFYNIAKNFFLVTTGVLFMIVLHILADLRDLCFIPICRCLYLSGKRAIRSISNQVPYVLKLFPMYWALKTPVSLCALLCCFTIQSKHAINTGHTSKSYCSNTTIEDKGTMNMLTSFPSTWSKDTIVGGALPDSEEYPENYTQRPMMPVHAITDGLRPVTQPEHEFRFTNREQFFPIQSISSNSYPVVHPTEEFTRSQTVSTQQPHIHIHEVRSFEITTDSSVPFVPLASHGRRYKNTCPLDNLIAIIYLTLDEQVVLREACKKSDVPHFKILYNIYCAVQSVWVDKARAIWLEYIKCQKTDLYGTEAEMIHGYLQFPEDYRMGCRCEKCRSFFNALHYGAICIENQNNVEVTDRRELIQNCLDNMKPCYLQQHTTDERGVERGNHPPLFLTIDLHKVLHKLKDVDAVPHKVRFKGYSYCQAGVTLHVNEGKGHFISVIKANNQRYRYCNGTGIARYQPVSVTDKLSFAMYWLENNIRF